MSSFSVIVPTMTFDAAKKIQNFYFLGESCTRDT